MTRSSSAARAGLVGLAVAATVITVNGCGAVDDGPTSVVEGDPVAHPYNGAMHVEQDFGDRASVKERSGAAGLALECDYPAYDGGAGDYDSGLESVQDSPAAALDDWLAEESVDVPDTGYVIEREDDGRALLSLDVDDRTKVAVIVADDIRDWDDNSGWGVEAWATCDPAELGAAYHSSYGVRVWHDANGDPVPLAKVKSFPGSEHCDWQDITFLYVGMEPDQDTYLRDTEGELRQVLATTFSADSKVPLDARDTGWRDQGRELWLQPGRPDAAYLVSVDDPKDVERWPAAKDGVGCA